MIICWSNLMAQVTSASHFNDRLIQFCLINTYNYLWLPYLFVQSFLFLLHNYEFQEYIMLQKDRNSCTEKHFISVSRLVINIL